MVSSCWSAPTEAELRQQRDQMAEEAVQWLLSQQSSDGGWHSETHGILKGGQAYTPYILDALSDHFGKGAMSVEGLHYGLSFLLKAMDSLAVLGRTSGLVLEYPVYATSYAMRAIPKKPTVFDTTFAPAMIDYLMTQQFNENRGISPDHPAYGAWGFGETNLPFGEVGHVDLSHTRRALEALQPFGYATDDPLFKQARIFLDRLQKNDTSDFDGGFCASAYSTGTNKADTYEDYCVSYASATADGILALLATGLAKDDQRIQAARKWLLRHPRWDYVEGIPPDQPGNWGKVLFFYHISVRAQAYAKLGETGWEKKVLSLLAEHQQPDGSFSNPYGAPNKEDDPLLATALVLRALNAMDLPNSEKD